ncbi:hypothetical protein CCYN74_30072 [Capnocytophaga cynodegmi]|uniref:Uncharacterized protein n=1 Tax=Capnocytophaga cynodegmi TaxID=28189 RepID=A0A0B7HEI6_9FLAO|nr:hypothetical protein CCYN74_30072 [Capnocytophaga cynodegmi]
MMGSKLMTFKLLHPKKTLLPKYVTFLGILIVGRLGHTKKAESPIEINEFGKLTLSNFLQLLKALSAMLVTPSPITKLRNEE